VWGLMATYLRGGHGQTTEIPARVLSRITITLELRHYLEMMSERTAVRVPIEDVGDSLTKLNFRLLA
jgi:hypothetical protein